MDVHDQSAIPKHMIESIQNYIEHKLEPGGFLSAIICNDLKRAVGQADHINIKIIPHYVAYFYNHTPSNCWGSEERMNDWLSGGRNE